MKNVLLLFVFLCVACKSSPDKVEPSKSTAALEELQLSVDALFNDKIGENKPGASLLIAYDGEMLIGKGYGLRDLEQQMPMTQSTNVRMASVSKQFTALAILSLVDKGLLSLNDPISKFWPYPVFKDITVQHLLNHTSGLADYEEPYFLKDWDKTKVVENKDILEWLETNPAPIFEVGTQWEYCNTAYLVLALLVEKVSGEEFSAYAQENVFKKAGMDHTTFYNLAKPVEISERAYCHDKDSLGNWQKIDGYFMNGVLGDGAVYTSVNDYFKYDNALRNQSIVSKEMHALIFKPSTMPLAENSYDFDFLNNAEEKYGMGWFLTDEFALHTGSWNGTRTIVLKEFKRPLTIAIFLSFASSEIRNELIEATYALVDDYLENPDQ